MPTLNDILQALNNFIGDAQVGGATELRRKIFAINMAKDFLLSQVGLPSSEVTESIAYHDDQNVYPLDAGMIEPIAIRYDESAGQGDINKQNNHMRDFEFMRAQELYPLQSVSANDMVYWGLDYANNSNSIVIISNNIIPGQTINPFTTIDNLFISGFAANLAVDTSVYKEGNASVSIEITGNTGLQLSHILYQLNVGTDFSNYVANGVFTLWQDQPNSSGDSGVTLTITSDANPSSIDPTFTNYWIISPVAETFNDGWNFLQFNWADAVSVGSPDPTSITGFQINQGTTAISGPWRYNALKLYTPDQFLFTHYTDQVVQDATDPTLKKKDFVNSGDKALFASIDASIVNVVAAIAAGIYKPTSLNQDGSVANSIAKTGMDMLQYRFPKKVLSIMERLRTVTRSS